MQLVMILEDDVLLRAGMARSLNKLPSIEVVEASTVTEAIQLVDNLQVDLVLSDLQLGDGTALELLPRLEKPEGRIPVVLISGCLDKFDGYLPSGIEVRSKPMVPQALRELVARMLGCTEVRAPFTLPDYLQLAAFGRHSVQIGVQAHGVALGSVTVKDGLAWSAMDAAGDGLDALVRLLAVPEPTLECGPVVTPTPHSLSGSCEAVLIEAARILDERRAGRRTTTEPPSIPPVTITAHVPPVLHIPPALARAGSRPQVEPPALARAGSRPQVPPPAAARTGSRPQLAALDGGIAVARAGTRDRDAAPAAARAPARSPHSSEGPGYRAPGPPPPDFDQLYNQGIDALLAKRYREAFETLTRARQLRTTPTLEANLHRLRAMGFE